MTLDQMDLRDWFASFALPGVVARNTESDPDEIAREAYALADAMLRAREAA